MSDYRIRHLISGDNCMQMVRCLYLAGDGPRPVRAGSAWPLSPGRSVRRGSKIKRDFACTFTGHLLPVRVVLRSQSCLRLEGRARTLSGPSPDLSSARTLAPSSRCEDLLIRRFLCGHPGSFRSVRDLGRVLARCSCSSGFPEGCSPRWLPAWLPGNALDTLESGTCAARYQLRTPRESQPHGSGRLRIAARLSFARADSRDHLVVVRGAERGPVGNLRYGLMKHCVKCRAVQHSDGDLGLICGGDVVYDIDVEVFRILSRRLDLAVFEGNRGTSGRSPECLDLDLARRAGDVIGKPCLWTSSGCRPTWRSNCMTYSIPTCSISALANSTSLSSWCDHHATARANCQLGAAVRCPLPGHPIRRSRHIVQDCPLRSVRWADIPQLSVRDRRCPAAWRRSWQRSRPSAFQAGHIPSSCEPCECYALWLVAADSGWLLLLLSAAGPGPHLRGLPGPVTAPCPAQAPPPNPIAAEPDGRRVLSRGGEADHAVTPQAPWTGSGCREHSYGGFGGGHPPFQPHVWFPVPSQPTPDSCDTRGSRRGTSASMSPVDGKLSP
jgi:hypothetical protein